VRAAEFAAFDRLAAGGGPPVRPIERLEQEPWANSARPAKNLRRRDLRVAVTGTAPAMPAPYTYFRAKPATLAPS